MSRARAKAERREDITDDDAAQARLAASVDSSDDAIISKTLEGVVTSWHASAERLFGYTADEAVGRSITMIIPRERLAEEDEVLRRVSGGQRVDHFAALTSHARDEDRARTLAVGFQSHIVKPVDPDELVAQIARLVGR